MILRRRIRWLRSACTWTVLHDDRPAMLDSFEQESKKNPVSWENFLSVIAGNSSPDVLDLISRVEHSGSFRIEQANDQRALYGRFALNRKKSLQTEKGRSFLQETLLQLAPINEHSTVSMLRVFGALDAMEEADQVPLVRHSCTAVIGSRPEKTPSVYNTVTSHTGRGTPCRTEL